MKKHEGNLIIKEGDTRDFSQLEEITGYLDIYSNVTADLPKLTSVGGSLYINSNVTADLPKLTSVGGYLSTYSNVTLPKLTSVCGYLSTYSNVTLPKLTSVGGYLYINSNVTADLPKLTSVGGDLYIYSNVTADLPKLTSVGGYLSINSNVTLPKLTSVGGYLYIYSNVKFNHNITKNVEYKSVDRSLFIVESKRTSKGIKIYQGYNVVGIVKGKAKKQPCFVAEKDSFFAHGETLKKAIEDLQFKLISDKLKKEPIKADTVIDIKYYRLITGSCEMGVKSFIEANDLKESYKAKDLLPILEKKNAYGFEKFKALCKF